jgi:putative membrane protein
MGFMLGFVLGALIKVWPWQFDQQWLLPAEYENLSGQPGLFGLCLIATMVCALMVSLLSWKTTGPQDAKSET